MVAGDIDSEIKIWRIARKEKYVFHIMGEEQRIYLQVSKKYPITDENDVLNCQYIVHNTRVV